MRRLVDGLARMGGHRSGQDESGRGEKGKARAARVIGTPRCVDECGPRAVITAARRRSAVGHGPVRAICVWVTAHDAAD